MEFDFTEIYKNMDKMKKLQKERIERSKIKSEYPAEKIDSEGIRWIQMFKDNYFYANEDCNKIVKMKFNERGFLVIERRFPKNDDDTITICAPCEDGRCHRVNMDYFDILCCISRIEEW